MKRPTIPLMLLIAASIFVFFLLNLLLGSVSIPIGSVWNILWGGTDESVIWQNIIWKSRVPQALTALVAGAGLSISGLQMQTVFRNPLAGPSVLGISSGASLGVAFVVLLSGAFGGVALSKLGYMGEVALSLAAVIGALSVMALIVYVSQKVKGNVTLLIIGVMIGYVASAVIGVLKYFSVEEDIRAYVIWGLGSFARVSGDQMTLFVCIMVVLIPLSFLLIKTMNLMLLGDGYARNLGLNIKRARLLVISCSGVLVAIFDRTWYGRVMVERIEGFCSEAEWRRAYQEINEMESHMANAGAVVLKFWLHIDKDEQDRRFRERQANPAKQWKITDEDWRNREKWDQYEEAVNEMLIRTSTTYAPWIVVEGNDKRYARVKVLQTVVDALEKKVKEVKTDK